MQNVEKHLEELGLNEKEVKVYLASLESGAATAQQLAAKAAVVRPSAYVAIGGLTKRGLMSSYTKGKKQYYQAEKPERLMRLLEDEKKKLADREAKLKAMLPGLESLVAMSGDKPEVKYYEGLEGLEAMRAVLFENKIKKFDGICSLESLRKVIPEESRVLYGLRAKRSGLIGRQIIVTSDSKVEKPLVAPDKWVYKKMRGRNGLRGEIGIFGDFLSLVVYSQNPHGFLVKSRDLADTARILFEATWQKLK